MIDYLTKHGKAVSDHLLQRSKEETTAELRSFTEHELSVRGPSLCKIDILGIGILV